MYKLKIKKSIKDRFKVSKNGKISRRKMGARHLRSNKSGSNKRRDNIDAQVLGQWKKKITQLLGV
ncbi:MAG: 50S ribosomal protein L35 [Patescibacteria group bacterium]